MAGGGGANEIKLRRRVAKFKGQNIKAQRGRWCSCCAFPFIALVCLVAVSFSLTHLFVFFILVIKLLPVSRCMFYCMIGMEFHVRCCICFLVVFCPLDETRSDGVLCVVSQVCWCCVFSVALWTHSVTPLTRQCHHSSVFLVICCFFFLSPRVVPFLFLTCAAPLVIAHSGYWHLFSESCRCFSSCVLSSGSVIIVVRSCSAPDNWQREDCGVFRCPEEVLVSMRGFSAYFYFDVSIVCVTYAQAQKSYDLFPPCAWIWCCRWCLLCSGGQWAFECVLT